ncbi:Pentatricopeptide repeat-containing protein [Nymphaea thermarum]|nr:Pentatricopeptide repeat-containing protein [Nymphaea thermarum]
MVNSFKKKPLNRMLLVSLLHSCKTAKQLRSVHGTMIVSGALRESETFLWNSLIRSYRHCWYGSLEPILLYHQMMRNGIVFDKFTFPFVIKACTNLRTIKLGQQIHGQVVKSRHVVDHFVQGCLAGNMKEAKELFDVMPARDNVSWGIMVSGYVNCGAIDMARHVLDLMPRSNLFSWNALIDGYAKIGSIDIMLELFEQMKRKNLVSWNIVLNAFAKCDCSTLAVVLSAIADMGILAEGKWVHRYLERNQVPLSGNVGVALIDMYSKCGNLDIATEIFCSMPQKSVDHWNSMIAGHAVYGYGSYAIRLFEELQKSSVEPDDISFIAVLSACSHAGLVDEGHYYFNLMTLQYCLEPKIQHYGCLVDLLSRSGYVEEASLLVKNMPMKPNDVIWRALLGACKTHGNVVVGEEAAKHLFELDPDDTSSYSLLSDMYGAAGRWDDALKTRETMKEKGIKKLAPGCSSVESDAMVHEVDATLPDIPAGDTLFHGAENTYIVSEKEQFVLERISKERTRLWFDTRD